LESEKLFSDFNEGTIKFNDIIILY
jgi:hypothetical protein